MRQMLFRLTAEDFVWQTFASGGPGGQHQNKTQSGVRCVHRPSGAAGECRETRYQRHNKETAFRRMAESPAFQAWCRRMAAELMTGKTVDERVDEIGVRLHLKTPKECLQALGVLDGQGPAAGETASPPTGRAAVPEAMATHAPPVEIPAPGSTVDLTDPGRFTLDLVGENEYEAAVRQVAASTKEFVARIALDDRDPALVRVFCSDRLVGRLSRPTAARYGPLLRALRERQLVAVSQAVVIPDEGGGVPQVRLAIRTVKALGKDPLVTAICDTKAPDWNEEF